MFKLLVVAVLLGVCSARRVTFTNRCSQDIWIQVGVSHGGALREGTQRVRNGATGTYQIPDGEWGGRFWPKVGCNGTGQNCAFGQSEPPCPSGGCHPPADTKVEFYFPPLGSRGDSWYDVSLVDGYSFPAKIVPSQKNGGSCTETTCSMPLSSCPRNEKDVGDLRVTKNGQTVACLAPCKKWNYPAPYGMGKDEQVEPGRSFCCPTPPVSSEQCRRGPVVSTEYVKLIRKTCPTAYSFAYDDEGGLHNCPNHVDFFVTFCP